MGSNSKFLLLILIVALIASCGVKNDPIPPKNTKIPSYPEKFLKLKKKKKNLKDKESLGEEEVSTDAN